MLLKSSDTRVPLSPTSSSTCSATSSSIYQLERIWKIPGIIRKFMTPVFSDNSKYFPVSGISNGIYWNYYESLKHIFVWTWQTWILVGKNCVIYRDIAWIYWVICLRTSWRRIFQIIQVHHPDHRSLGENRVF